MTIFRVLAPLDAGGSRGRIEPEATPLSMLEWLTPEKQEMLVAVGAVAPVATPPLSVLPGFAARATKLARANIATVEDLLTANAADVAEALHTKVETVDRWQAEARAWLFPGRTGATKGG